MANSLEKLLKILNLEEEQQYANKAVIGGLDAAHEDELANAHLLGTGQDMAGHLGADSLVLVSIGNGGGEAGALSLA